MRVFLVDFENVHSEGLVGVDTLTENDEVVVFYSNNADSITFEMMHKLMFCKAKLCYYKIRRGGRNALDFQMASYLGYLINACSVIKNKPEVEFFLISKDSGFDFVIDFWESGNINIKPIVKRFYTIKAAFGQGKKTVASKSEEVPPPVEIAVKTTVPEVEEPVIVEVKVADVVEAPKLDTEVNNEIEINTEVERLLSVAKSSHELYISMVKRFGQKKGVELYRNIKSRFIVKKTG